MFSSLHGTTQPFITAHWQTFKATGSILSLATMLAVIIRQHRTLELLYGGYCQLFHGPSPVEPCEDEAALIAILQNRPAFIHHGTVSREQLIASYGESFRVDLLPPDFAWARWESIWREDEQLIIGEYGEDSRIAHVTPTSCALNTYYRQVRGVRHIHSIEKYGECGEFLVTTGDSSKFLDLWFVGNGQTGFVRRLTRHLAGFTAVTKVNGEYFFGTDFSSRPNCIQTLDGTKYFFPEKAYKLYVAAFFAFFDRYFVCVNTELSAVGPTKTVSVFDAHRRRFVFCEYWDAAGTTAPHRKS